MSEPKEPGAKTKATVAKETVLDEHRDGAPHITVDDKGHAHHYMRPGCKSSVAVVPIVVSPPPLGERPNDARGPGAGDERRVPDGVGLDQLGDEGRRGVIELFRAAARGNYFRSAEMLRAYEHAKLAFGEDEALALVLADFNVTLADAGGAGGVA